jgi:hypothetical protein
VRSGVHSSKYIQNVTTDFQLVAEPSVARHRLERLLLCPFLPQFELVLSRSPIAFLDEEMIRTLLLCRMPVDIQLTSF